MNKSSQSKQQIVAEAHKNPEYAAMSARKLCPIIGVSQPVISKWRRTQRLKEFAANNPAAAKKFGVSKTGRILKAKVTVASVRRKWEEKYAALNRQYEWLGEQHIEMAKKADYHCNNEKSLEGRLYKARKEIEALKNQVIELENRSWISRLFNLKD